MRFIRNLAWMWVLAIALNACFTAPEFPIVPEIEFNNIIFKKGPAPTQAQPSPADSLIVTVNFRDGDGDLGLDAFEPDTIYNDKFYPRLADGKYITYKMKRTVPEYQSLPDFVTPYNCTNWEVLIDINTHTAVDTIYFLLNPNTFNIFIDFYVQQNDKTFALYDWKTEFIYPNCNVNGFNGRFPVLSKDLSQSTAQEGKIRYSMKSVGFNIIFSIKVLKLKITIQDRALHKSNVVETPAFTLQSIRQ